MSRYDAPPQPIARCSECGGKQRRLTHACGCLVETVRAQADQIADLIARVAQMEKKP